MDGEHYPPVVQAALEGLEHDYGFQVAGIVFVGGLEKVSNGGEFGRFGYRLFRDPDPLVAVQKAVDEEEPALVVDLSDEPVLGYVERLRLASLVLSRGVPYAGADFRFEPPIFEKVLVKPSIGIIGTGKRVGKTAIAGYASRVLQGEGLAPCVIAMGRGGPPEPEVIPAGSVLTPEYLLEMADRGRHAASDYFEDALTSQITTIGCRRCGGGLAGEPFISNVAEGARIANTLVAELVLLEGSGATLPPVRWDAALLTVGADQPVDYIGGYFGTYRVLLADAAVITMCEEPMADEGKVGRVEEAIRAVKPAIKVVRTVFRPKPLGTVDGARVFLATTAQTGAVPSIVGHLESVHGASVVAVSDKLANRKVLREEIEAAPGFDVLMTELKAASVDVVTRIGIGRGLPVVYLDNEPVTVGGDGELRDVVVDIARLARSRFENGETGVGRKATGQRRALEEVRKRRRERKSAEK